MPTPIVANILIDALSLDGEAFQIELEVGTPYRCETGEWACPIALRGLHDRLHDVHGEDSFQAICLAIRLAQMELQGFRERGGKLLMGNGDFPLEAYGLVAAAWSVGPRASA
jgi:hypothetical protein